MRMSREAYVRLCTHFRHKLWLHDSRHVSVEEKMVMFLTIIGHNERYVVIKRRFQHSSQTIHKYFHEVLAAMMTFAREMIVPSTFDPNPDNSGAHKSLRRIFKGAVGSLDGTLVHAIIPSSQQTVYRGKGKGKCYQNVLGICDFNTIFTFVYAGWEGVAHDSMVLTEVMAALSNNFPFPPPSKYYICDVAYTNTRGFMAPVRYWLEDFRRRRAMTKEEKFNHAHAKLRNVIERAYGVLKARFPILDKMAPYPFNVQRNVVIACFAVNNFIRKEKINDELFAQYEEPHMVMEQVGHEENVEFTTTGSYWSAGYIQFMSNMCEEIAVQLIGNI
ncbi:LOW QUALITY PROTEIN: DDE_4 domain-containing protein [Cephalotus follicularis]|uniref:DDE_4 domain-containing protein n=1 Tax=Cephalotus follicularis TaxID=3775 RepID=A0A1Q3BJC2_CEPFO|nr:LOW QUALITY PROTEIN: DDE_4 domain-containing protein [Cephalotus follicularis]